jgi:hypothetical protein
MYCARGIRIVTNFSETQWRGLGTDGRIILIWMLEIGVCRCGLNGSGVG